MNKKQKLKNKIQNTNNIRLKISNYFKDKNNLLFIFVLFLFTITFFYQTNNLEQLPACYYGCDLHSHLGTLEHLNQGGSYFENAQINEAKPWTPQLYHIIVVLISNIFSITLIKSSYMINLLFLLILGFYLYNFSIKFFENNKYNKQYGIMLILMYLTTFPIMKYREFSFIIIMPIFLYYTYNFFLNKTTKNTIILGLALGITGNSHTLGFIISCLILGIMGFYEIIIYKNFKYLKKYIYIGLIGGSISLIYWWWPIYNKFQELNFITEYGHYNYSSYLSVVLDFFSIIKNSFFNFSNLYNILTSIIVLIGIILLFITNNKKEKKNQVFLVILLISFLIASSHHLITIPLLNKSIFPYMLAIFIIFSLSKIIFLFSINRVYNIFNSYSKIWLYINYTIIFLLIINTFSVISNRVDSSSYNTAKNVIPTHYQEIQNWIKNNTKLNDVFLTSKENCFMLNGFTGRKCMVYRNTHTDPFIDVFQRDADAAVILYGNNTQLRKELIDKYNIDYIYWDYYWINSEFRLNDKGEIVGFFDSIKIIHSYESEKYFKENGVKYITIENQYLDPAQKKGYNTYDVIIPLPNNSIYPWDDSLNDILEPVWSRDEQDQEIVKIFKIKK